MNTQRRRFVLVTALLALGLAGVSGSVRAGPDAGGVSLRVCTFPGAGLFARDATGQASGLEYDLMSLSTST
jgi:hypothetical protein